MLQLEGLCILPLYLISGMLFYKPTEQCYRRKKSPEHINGDALYIHKICQVEIFFI